MPNQIIVACLRQGLGMDYSREVVESLGRMISKIPTRGRAMKSAHRGGGIVGDLGRLTFGMTAFLKTCNRSSVLNTGPVTGAQH